MKNEIAKSNISEKENKKFLILKRYDISVDKQGKILGQIKNYVKSQNIFDFNQKIKLGKLDVIKGPRFDKDKKLIPYSFVGDKYFVTQRREAIKSITHIFKPSSKQDKINKEFNKIKSESDMYSRYIKTFSKLTTNNNNINNEKGIITPIPKYLKKNLLKQERILKRQENYENFEENIINKLLKKTNKNKKDLLLKMNDLSNSSNYLKTDDLNANLKNWNFKLRNPKIDGIYKRKGYFKVTSLNEDLFSIINLNKEKQIFVNPFKNNFYKHIKNSLNSKTTRIDFLSTLKLKGKNILDKRFSNKRKMNRIIENSQSFKSSSYKNFNQNLSFIEKNERNLSQNFEDRIFAFNYNLKYKYDKTEIINKFHN